MLTASQHKTLHFIREYISSNHYSPSLADIAEGIGIKSRGVVHRYVQALADAGLIELTPGRQRSIQLVSARETISGKSLPFLGKVAAGLPIEAVNTPESINLSDEVYADDRYALEVDGDSMIDAGIFDGDIAIIKQQEVASNGDIVVALIDEQEATLKRFNRVSSDMVELVPENKSMKVIQYHAARVKIQGVLVGQYRKYK